MTERYNDAPVHVLKTQGQALCVAFSPDGTLLASASDNWTVRLWRVIRSSEEEE